MSTNRLTGTVMPSQESSELRPALASSIHLKRAAFSRYGYPKPWTGKSGVGGAGSCIEPILLISDEASRGNSVAFPHPFGITANESTSWHVLFHAINIEGLRVPHSAALQCTCMRDDIGSQQCCPHSCRFPTHSGTRASSVYRLSLTLTWLLGSANENEDLTEIEAELRPLTTMWIPVGKPSSTQPDDCSNVESETEVDMPACRGRQSSVPRAKCESIVVGEWMELRRPGVVVAALGMPTPHSTELMLRNRGTSSGESIMCQHASTQPLERWWRPVFCSFDKGESMPLGSAFQAGATFNTSIGVLGANSGFMVWIEF